MAPDWEDAIARGDAARVRALVAAGADVDAKDRHGQTGLMRAAHAGHAEVVRALLEAGAALDPTAKHGLSALMLAALVGHEDVVRRLLDAGADPTLRGSGAPGFHDRTALDLAVAGGWTEVARLLREGAPAATEADGDG
jgi:ankyrin repeat protein